MSYRNEGIHKDTIRDACPAGTEVRLFMEKEAHYFDAILMDIVMPKMDGFACTGEDDEIGTLRLTDLVHVQGVVMQAGDGL